MRIKKMLAVLFAVLLILGMALAGCAKQTATPTSEQQTAAPGVGQPTNAPAVEQPTTPPVVEQPSAVPEKSQITIVIAEDPPSFNAEINQSGFDVLVMELVMLGMADLDQEGNVFPELAAELPSIDNGDVVIDEANGTMDVTWKFRQDIQWSDGTPVTANDLVFTYDAVVDPEKGYYINGIEYVDSVEKIDDYTAVVHYNAIYPAYLTQFGGYLINLWPAHYCDAAQGFTQWDCGLQPLSNGPYVLKEWVQNDHLTFERNPNYYEAGKPGIDQIIVKIIPDEAIRKQMLIKGDADLDMWTVENVIAELKNEPNVEVSLSPVDRWVMRIFLILPPRAPPIQ